MKNKSGIIGIIITTVILIVVVIVSNISTGNLTFVRDTIGKMFIPMQNGLIYIKEKITGNDQQLSDMESLKEKIPMIIAVVVAIAICVAILYFFENYESAYFTQIDNTKIEKLSSTDDMKYKYTLECYNEKGKKKELKFKTSRELKEDAFLKLEVKTLGVHSWKEVQYDELPKKVQTNYTK